MKFSTIFLTIMLAVSVEAGCNDACTSYSDCSGTCFICLNGLCRPKVAREARDAEALFKKETLICPGGACTSASDCPSGCNVCREGVCHVTRKRVKIDIAVEEMFKRESLACGKTCSAAGDCSGSCPFCIGSTCGLRP